MNDRFELVGPVVKGLSYMAAETIVILVAAVAAAAFLLWVFGSELVRLAHKRRFTGETKAQQ